MQEKQITLYLYAETPVHVGMGTGLGSVDMPIQREVHTAYPLIQASGVKGALRDTAEVKWGLHSPDENTRKQAEVKVKSIFGGASGSDDETHAGAISPSDARILCFPVRALKGVFVWVTSPTVLERFRRETDINNMPKIPSPAREQAFVADATLLTGNQIMLEEFTYSASYDDNTKNWAKHLADQFFADDGYWNTRFKTHFVVLPDDEFRDFVRYSTEIVTRIHLDDETKIVKEGPFMQELLPADSVLYSSVRITDSRNKRYTADEVYKAVNSAFDKRIQIGGDETVGRGRMRLKWGNSD